MKTFVMSDIQKTAYNAVTGNDANLTKKQLNDAIREKIKDVCGGTFDYYKYMNKQWEIFAIIAELMPAATQASLAGKFDSFAEFKDTAMGDKNYFNVEDNRIYPLVTSARGNSDVERNKIIDRNLTVVTERKAITFYDELDNFMAGKITIERMSEKAVEAHGHFVGELVSDTIYNSYSAVNTLYKFTGAYDAAELVTIIEQVKAATGADRLQIFGTTTALANITDVAGTSDREKERFNGFGFYDTFRGTDLIALPQSYRAGTDPQTLAVNNANLIILPADEKIVKVVFEGVPVINSGESKDRNDEQIEISYARRVGAVALTVPEGMYGLYRFS